MQVKFSNTDVFDLAIQEHDVGNVYNKIYKHLHHAKLEFREWDNPYYLDQISYEQLVDKLTLYAGKVGVAINRELALAKDQSYFNQIHKIYETNYNGNSQWLDFHEHIHLCEVKPNPHVLDINYREKSGMLETPFDLNWLAESTYKLNAGDVYVTWAELGKTPYAYWRDNEPDDLNRLCQLAKPWLTLRPCIKIALEDVNNLENIRISEFELWWTKHEKEWCRHWNLKSWSVQQIFSGVVFGHVQDIDRMRLLLQNNIRPTGIIV